MLVFCLKCGMNHKARRFQVQSLFSLLVKHTVVQERWLFFAVVLHLGGSRVLFYSDTSITVAWQAHRVSVFFFGLEHRYEIVWFYVCRLPLGRLGQPAAGKLSLSAPSAPSCWSRSPLPFPCPPSLAAPSAALWFSPRHQGVIETDRRSSRLIHNHLISCFYAALTGLNSQQ